MAREIKFRAWGHQVTGNYRMFYSVALNSWSIPIWEDEPICDHALMQFIGLLDKNGNEIYERDIVKGRYVDYLDGEYFENDEIIELDAEGPCRADWEDCEIIGNIYENPELKE